MTRALSTVVAALALALVGSGCEKKDGPTPAAPKDGSGVAGALDAMKDAGKDMADKATAALEETKTKFLAEAQTQLDGVKKQIDGWKPKVEALAGDFKKPAQDALAAVETKFNAATSELAKVKDGKSDTFESMKGGLSKSLTELTDAVKSFSDKFKF